MPQSIQSIPTPELESDREASIVDIAICKVCLSVGVTHHRDGLPVQSRINDNLKIIEVIEAELDRRGAPRQSARLPTANQVQGHEAKL